MDGGEDKRAGKNRQITYPALARNRNALSGHQNDH